jgi:hypothetical protein
LFFLKEYSLTENGYLERSYPFLSMRMPRRMWPSIYYQNAKQNQRKLISHYDTYKTLNHFLYMNKRRMLIDNQTRPDVLKCRANFEISEPKERIMRGVSLFETVSATRVCKDAFVPIGYCNCQEQVDLTRNEFVFANETGLDFKIAAQFVIEQLNSMTYPYRRECELFELESIKKVTKLFTSLSKVFKFNIKVLPGEVEFQSIVRIVDQNTIELVGKILRMSIYGHQSDCMTDGALHGFCFCKESL